MENSFSEVTIFLLKSLPQMVGNILQKLQQPHLRTSLSFDEPTLQAFRVNW